MWCEAEIVFINFNSHAHVERDQRQNCRLLDITNFNSHAHVERDNDNIKLVIYTENFNSHAHVERDVLIYDTCYEQYQFQLTRSRGA